MVDNTLLDNDFDLGWWSVTPEKVQQYLQAVGDTNQEYYTHQLVPPLALAAYALGTLLQRLNLPPGAIHSLQEVDALHPVGFGEEVRATARLERSRRRGNLEFLGAAYWLENARGQLVQTGKSTVLITRPAQGD
jgi:hypothetical protein